MSELPSWLEHVQKSKVMEMGSSRFYSLNETVIELNLGPAMEWLISCNEQWIEERESCPPGAKSVSGGVQWKWAKE
jgi:hypothetical protein